MTHIIERKTAKLYPLWGDGPPLLLWTENGRVFWEDARNGQYGSMDWAEAARRVLSISEMIRKSRETGRYWQELRRAQQFVCDMEEVLRQAKEQTEALSKRKG